MMTEVTERRTDSGLPQWYRDGTGRTRTGLRNPGRRGITADLYAFPVRLPMEAPFVRHPEYRRLRYAFDVAERRISRLTAVGASSQRIGDAQQVVNVAGAAIAGFLLRHVGQEETPPAPVVLTRELDADGTLVSETETPVEGPAQ
jgi:hypothetical protein